METRKKLQGKNERIEKWDIARACLIFLVVLGHFVDYHVEDSANMRALFVFIYSFHMPCLLFIDGMFSKRNVDEKRYNHIFSYLVLYLASQILISLTRGIIRHEITFNLFSENGLPWYGLALFWCSLMTIFLKRFPKRWVIAASVVLACIVGYDSNVKDTLALSRTIVFFPFFYLGYCVDPKRLAEAVSSRRAKISGLAILIAAALLCYFKIDDFYFVRALVTGRNPYNSFRNTYGMDELVFYGGLCRLAWYGVVAMLGAAVFAVIPAHAHGWRLPTAVGRRTLQIYILHKPFLYILYEGLHLDRFLEIYGISKLVLIPVAAFLTLFLALPFWEKTVRAIIYPQVSGERKEIKSNSRENDERVLH